MAKDAGQAVTWLGALTYLGLYLAVACALAYGVGSFIKAGKGKP